MTKYSLYKNILLSITCILLVTACSSDDNGETGFQLVSASVENNAVVNPAIESIIFTFNKGIYIADKTKLTLNSSALTDASVYGTSLTVKLGTLEHGTNYTFIIDKGAIKDGSNNLNKETFTLSFSTEKAPEITANLVMPNASSQAKKVYQFLVDNYKKNIISGAMARVNWNTDEADRVYRWTGKYPALNCFDFVHHYASPANWIDYSNTTVAENWWNNNGLVAIMWHWNVPKLSGSADVAFYTSETAFDITKAVQEGTTENTRIKQDMDAIAGYLLALQNKNIPVIWRPLHEASGGWFWWGAQGADACKKLWIIMFDYFKAKGINNLIWVWTTQTNDSDWYPGDAYVDMIGRDMYNTTSASAVATDYESIVKQFPNKMVALSECGNVATITSQWNANANWSWFMPWYDYNATDTSVNEFATKEFWEDAFNRDYVITRDLMPSLK